MHGSQFRVRLIRPSGQQLSLLLPAEQLPSYIFRGAALVDDLKGLSLELERFGGDIEDSSIKFGEFTLTLPYTLHGARAGWGISKIAVPAEVIAEQLDLDTLLADTTDGKPAVLRIEIRIHHQDPELLERIQALPPVTIEILEEEEADGIGPEGMKQLLYYHLRGDVILELFISHDLETLHQMGFHEPPKSPFR